MKKGISIYRISALILFVTISCQAITVDFETEDDFSTPLVNGQVIDAEFGHQWLTVNSRIIGSDGHLGPVIFNSNNPGPNVGSQDPDLLVGLGNILILQNDDSPTQTVPGIFDNPNDEASFNDRGAIVFDFMVPVDLHSIDLIDVDGGVTFELTLTDDMGRQRQYSAGPNWTTDITVSGDGYETLL